jgi:chromosome segregation ATPase
VLKKIEAIGSRLDALAKEPRNDGRVMEILRKLEQRIADSETTVTKMASEKKPANGETELADLRAALQVVTLRYSEIGDLKKNHLILSNKLETLQHDFDVAKNGGNKAILDKVREMDIEVPALRAEVRQILTRIEALDAEPQADPNAMNSMQEEIEGMMKAVSDLGTEVALMRSELSHVEESIAPPSILEEPVPTTPMENDVRAIRQDMKEIRSLIHSLANRP